MPSAPLDANLSDGCQYILGSSPVPCTPGPVPNPNNCPCPPCECGTIATADCVEHSSSSSYSGQPVRYSSGEIRLVTQDLSSRGFGLPWGHTRSYSNRVSAPDQGINGGSWFVREVPQVANVNPGADPDQATMVVIGIINDALWFDWVPGSTYQYNARFPSYKATLTYDWVNKLLVLTDQAGQQIKFSG